MGASGSISIAQQISRYIRPERSKEASTFRPSKTDGSQRESFKIDKMKPESGILKVSKPPLADESMPMTS